MRSYKRKLKTNINDFNSVLNRFNTLVKQIKYEEDKVFLDTLNVVLNNIKILKNR